MVREVLLTVGPEDVLKCSFTCANCKTSLTFKMDNGYMILDACPSCHTMWRNNEDASKVFELFKVLKDIRRLDNPPIEVHMVFNAEDD